MPSESPYRFLAVDDDPAALLIFRGIVESAGFEFMGVLDGKAGLAAMEEFDPDVISLDVQLPGMSGLAVCKAIKSNPESRLIPVLIATALNDSETQLQGIEAGCDDFVTKPIDRIQLTARIRVMAQASRSNRELERAEQVISTLAASVEARDPTTGEHCRRVGAMAADLGTWIGLSADSIWALDLAGTLHDVGKIGVPDSILLKESNLTDDEWSKMRMHPVIGEQIVGPLHSLRTVLPIIRHHHERFDGGGYPDGLREDKIPIEARVFQIADAFDALVNERPYKKAFSRSEALSILREEAGSGRWDPEIFGVFADRLKSS